MVASERGKRNRVLSDEPSRSDIVADAQTIFLERQSSPGQPLCAYVSVFRCIIYCDSFPIVSLISHSGILYSIVCMVLYSMVCMVYCIFYSSAPYGIKVVNAVPYTKVTKLKCFYVTV